MRLVACRNCHTQYDVTDVSEARFDCRCGTPVENVSPTPVDARVRRCRSCGAAVGDDAAECEYCGSAIVRDERELDLICPECYARNEEQSRFCTACGVEFQPEPVPSAAEELPCVKCGCLMPRRRVGGILVHECPRCHGLWAPRESFDELVNRAIDAQRRKGADRMPGPGPRTRRGNPVTEPVQYRKCPVCGAYMLRRNFRRTSGVVIDRCHEHGTWLDADELEQIAGFILDGGLERSLAEELAAARRPEPSHAPRELQKVLLQRRTSSHEFRGTLLETFGRLLGDLFS